MTDLTCITVSRIPGLNHRERLLIAELFPDSKDLLTLSSGDISRITGRKLKSEKFHMRALLEEAERILEYTEKNGIKTVWFWDPEYPPQLREIFDPPVLLYLKGCPLIIMFFIQLLWEPDTRLEQGGAMHTYWVRHWQKKGSR